MIKSLLCVSGGAAFGASLRWLLGLGLNGIFPLFPLGTLVANLLGGYLIGVGLSFFALFPSLAPEWRLFVLTGFLGALTTFSTFSGEVVALLQQQRIAWALAVIGGHVLGSLGMTFLGLGSVTLFRHIVQ